MAQKPKIEVSEPNRRSPFSLKQHGITEDKTKAYRWVAPNRIDERKHNDNYELVKGGSAVDGTYRTKGNMVLMARSMDYEQERKKQKEQDVRDRTSAVKNEMRNRVERLSSHHGIDLHKNLDEEDGR